MRLLLDTHILIGAMKEELAGRFPAIAELIGDKGNSVFVSAASIWEIAIKSRLGKLDVPVPLAEIGGYLASVGFDVISIRLRDVVARAVPEPATRDPFDRLLLAQCAVEGMKLVTLDRRLAGHPLSATS